MQKLQKNYDALLQMYGEKAEEAEELKLDLLDVKAMYRSQVMCCLCFTLYINQCLVKLHLLDFYFDEMNCYSVGPYWI